MRVLSDIFSFILDNESAVKEVSDEVSDPDKINPAGKSTQ